MAFQSLPTVFASKYLKSILTIIDSQGNLQENSKKNSEMQIHKSQIQFWRDLELPGADSGLKHVSPTCNCKTLIKLPYCSVYSIYSLVKLTQ